MEMKIFSDLKVRCNQHILVEVVGENSSAVSLSCILRHVIDYKCIVVDITSEELRTTDLRQRDSGLYSIPFIGNCEGIKEILFSQAQVIYSNNLLEYSVKEHSNIAHKLDEVNGLREIFFHSKRWNLKHGDDDFYINELPLKGVMRLYNVANRSYVPKK